jgi:hypothetical protein
MHTLRTANNKIIWMLVVHGDIPNWPDVTTEFEVDVPPHVATDSSRTMQPASEFPLVNDELSVQIAGGQTAFAPGDSLTGIASWNLPKPPREIELRLFWYTRGKGTSDVQVVHSIPIANPPSQDRHRFAFSLPDGPYSFSGTLISLAWGIEIVAEPKDRAERVEIVCAPGGREILLTS